MEEAIKIETYKITMTHEKLIQLFGMQKITMKKTHQRKEKLK